MSKEIAVPDGMLEAAGMVLDAQFDDISLDQLSRALDVTLKAVLRYQQEHPPQFTDEQILSFIRTKSLGGYRKRCEEILNAAFREAYSVPEQEYPEALKKLLSASCCGGKNKSLWPGKDHDDAVIAAFRLGQENPKA